MVKTSVLLFGSFLLTIIPAYSQVKIENSRDQVRNLAEEAYIFAYPMLENYKTLYLQTLDKNSPAWRTPLNTFYHSDHLIGPDYRAVVRPNNDTLYSFAWLDLSAEPYVLTVPEDKDRRYYSFQLIDMYTHNYGYVGIRTTGTNAGSYLIAGPNWKGKTPPGISKVIQSEGNYVYVLGRTAVQGEKDLPNVRTIQQQYKLESLSKMLGKQPASSAIQLPTFPIYDPKKAASADFIGFFNYLLGQLKIDKSEVALIKKWRAIGIGPNLPFNSATLDPEIRKAIDDGVATALQKIKDETRRLGTKKNGWQLSANIFGNRKTMQSKYLVRAAAAMFALYGNDTAEAYYPSTAEDDQGKALDGSKHAYTLRFTKEQIPPVNAFWSATMYQLPEQLMTENPINRFSIGDRTEGLKYDADGSLTIYLQHDNPGPDKASNWLPAPNGPFSIMMRLYIPKPSALNPIYAPSPIRQVQSNHARIPESSYMQKMGRLDGVENPELAEINKSQNPKTSGDEVNEANNPLTPKLTINFHDYYAPSLYGAADRSANQFLLRGLIPLKKGHPQLLRFTMPIVSAPKFPSGMKNGLGDLALFDLFVFSHKKLMMGIGPLFVLPTATNSLVGSGKWQIGFAGVMIHPQKWGMLGGLLTYQHSFAGDKDRRTQNLMTFQPVFLYNLPQRYYIRSTAVMNFDFESENRYIPLGLGLGKVWPLKSGTVINAFIEPQFTVYRNGEGMPKYQFFMGVNFQFPLKH